MSCNFNGFNNGIFYPETDTNFGGIGFNPVVYGKFGRPADVPFP